MDCLHADMQECATGMNECGNESGHAEKKPPNSTFLQKLLTSVQRPTAVT